MSGIRLKATITPEEFPYLEAPLTVINQRNIAVRSGHVSFYVTPNFVVAVKKSLETTKWDSPGTWEYKVYEIRTKIEMV